MVKYTAVSTTQAEATPRGSSRRREASSGFRHQLYVIIFETDTRAGAAFDIILLITILFSVFAVVLESVPTLRHHYGRAFRLSEYAFTSAFTVEYLLRLAVAPKKGRALLFFPSLADGTPDERTLHAGEPTAAGEEKWVAQLWLHEGAYKPTAPAGSSQEVAEAAVVAVAAREGLKTPYAKAGQPA